jgi:ABC-2 type transport system permease protein
MHLLLQIGDQVHVLYPAAGMSEADLRGEVEAALRRAGSGFLKTVGIWHPSEDPLPDPYGGTVQPIATWRTARAQLAENYAVRSVDLSSGRVPGDVDVLVVIAPQGMSDAERYAIDQYLMRGGPVIVAAGNYALSPQQMGGGITMDEVQDGLGEMLASYGVRIGEALVLDPQNEPFPVTVQRQVGTMEVIELQQINYPFFASVLPDGMAEDSAIVANLPAITLQWASPLEIDEEANQDRQVTVLLESSPDSWLSSSVDVNPNLEAYPEFGFPVEGEQAARPLAVSIQGTFDSFFKDQPAPVPESAGADNLETQEAVAGTIASSPEGTRLVVVGSSEFLNDTVLEISRGISQDRYLHNLQFLENAADWAVEDEDLLSIRSRGTYARLLRPLTQEQQSFWEGLNYAVALLGVVAIGILWAVRRRNEQPIELVGDRRSRGAESEWDVRGEGGDQGT